MWGSQVCRLHLYSNSNAPTEVEITGRKMLFDRLLCEPDDRLGSKKKRFHKRRLWNAWNRRGAPFNAGWYQSFSSMQFTLSLVINLICCYVCIGQEKTFSGSPYSTAEIQRQKSKNKLRPTQLIKWKISIRLSKRMECIGLKMSHDH